MIAMASKLLLSVVLIFLITTCQSQPRFEYSSVPVINNSYFYYEEISMEDGVLQCVTNMSIDCCNDTNVSNWRDERGELVQEGADDGTCLYVTRGDGEISLNRRNNVVFHPHQDCGDVIFLTPVERYRASTSTSVEINHMVDERFC